MLRIAACLCVADPSVLVCCGSGRARALQIGACSNVADRSVGPHKQPRLDEKDISEQNVSKQAASGCPSYAGGLDDDGCWSVRVTQVEARQTEIRQTEIRQAEVRQAEVKEAEAKEAEVL